MKYGIISDSHDNFYNLEKAVEFLEKEKIETCFHLGDFCAPGFVKAMTDHQDLNWICVWGNVDGAKAKILLEYGSKKNFDIVDESFREWEVPEGKIFLTHFPTLARHASETGQYRAVFYGDDHTKNVEKQANGTVLANPGELVGFKTGQPSFGIYDSTSNAVTLHDLDDFRVASL